MLRWAMLLLVSALALTPVDVSLRVFPQDLGSTFVPAYYAGIGWSPPPYYGVWVGGCTDLYAPPDWFWVW